MRNLIRPQLGQHKQLHDFHGNFVAQLLHHLQWSSSLPTCTPTWNAPPKPASLQRTGRKEHWEHHPDAPCTQLISWCLTSPTECITVQPKNSKNSLDHFQSLSITFYQITFYHRRHSVLTSPSSPPPKGPDSVRAVTAAVPWSSSAESHCPGLLQRSLGCRHKYSAPRLNPWSPPTKLWERMKMRLLLNLRNAKNAKIWYVLICSKMVPQYVQ